MKPLFQDRPITISLIIQISRLDYIPPTLTTEMHQNWGLVLEANTVTGLRGWQLPIPLTELMDPEDEISPIG